MRAENSPLLRYTRDLASARSGYAVFTAPHMREEQTKNLKSIPCPALYLTRMCVAITPPPPNLC